MSGSLVFETKRRGTPMPWAQPHTRGFVAGILADERRHRERRGQLQAVPDQAEPLKLVKPCSPSERLLAAWAPVEGRVREIVGEAIWNIWLAGLHPHSLIGGEWTLGWTPLRPGAGQLTWVRARHSRVIEACTEHGVCIVECGGSEPARAAA
jgi:hypothetical protein